MGASGVPSGRSIQEAREEDDILDDDNGGGAAGDQGNEGGHGSLDEGQNGPVGPLQIALSGVDLTTSELVQTFAIGETVNLAGMDAGNLALEVLTTGQGVVRSILVEYQEAVLLHNTFPVLIAADEIGSDDSGAQLVVSAYSGPNGTGEELAQGAFTFTFTGEGEIGNGGMGHDDGGMGHDDGDMGHDDGGVPMVAPPGEGASASEISAYVAAVKASGEAHFHDVNDSKHEEHMAAMNLVDRSDATHIAVKDGAWSDSATWYNGSVPGDDAKVLIPDGIQVSYGTVSNASLFTVRVDGTLDFETDTDSRIVFDTFEVSPTGKLVVGTSDDPIDPDVNVDMIVANNGAIDPAWDPFLLSRGLISHGETSIHGATKDSHEKVVEDPMAGDSWVRFAEVPEGWKVGDTIVIAGTHYEGYKYDGSIGRKRHYEPEDEVRVITEISADGLIFFDEPLVYDHDSPRADLKTSVGNYTRNISVETENAEDAEVFERGHVMFMHSDKVDVRYAEFHELGRTDKSLDSRPVSDFNDIKFDSNVQGRYSLHIHRAGVEDLEDPAMFVGNAVFGSPGWGYVHHDSNAVLENNASYDTFGAGYVAETGNETGAWVDNIAIYAKGISWARPKGTSETSSTTFDIARGGDGFWFQGRLVESSDNVAASVNTGFTYFHRNGDDQMINFDSDLFEFPEALYYDDDVTADDASIRLFENNEAFAAKEGLVVVKANPRQGHDVWSELDGFTAWSVQGGAHLEYTAHYILKDFDLIGKDHTQFSSPRDGISIGNNVFDLVIDGAKIDGFEVGIDLNKSTAGNLKLPVDKHNYVLLEVELSNVETALENYDPRYDQQLTRADLQASTPDLVLDGPLTYQEGVNDDRVEIEGTKVDGIGETDFPGGADDFDLERSDVIKILETNGYWTTEDGQAYFLVDLLFTDRANGEIYYETQPVYINKNVPLDNPNKAYANAVDNGVQDIKSVGGYKTAGNVKLGKAT